MIFLADRDPIVLYCIVIYSITLFTLSMNDMAAQINFINENDITLQTMKEKRPFPQNGKHFVSDI